jgi:hypothetical protein
MHPIFQQALRPFSPPRAHAHKDQTMPLTTDEQERHAYARGDTREVQLLARIDALQRALGQAIADLDEANQSIDELEEVLNATH